MRHTDGIKEDGSAVIREFYQPWASVDFQAGESVRYTIITTPNGKTVVAGVRKPN
jgi:hypothetical protein